MRTEFGLPRSTCGCNVCQTNCRFMPGFLIPSDLDRLLPQGDATEWVDTNLLASPGAVAMKGGNVFRIRTLVPATKVDGSCINLSAQGLCQIHENAPFGCAFFDCGPERGNLSRHGLVEVMKAWEGPLPSMYAMIWAHLWRIGRRQHGPDVLRQRMTEYLEGNSPGTFDPTRREGVQ